MSVREGFTINRRGFGSWSKRHGRDWGAIGSIPSRKVDMAEYSFSVWCLMTR